MPSDIINNLLIEYWSVILAAIAGFGVGMILLGIRKSGSNFRQNIINKKIIKKRIIESYIDVLNNIVVLIDKINEYEKLFGKFNDKHIYYILDSLNTMQSLNEENKVLEEQSLQSSLIDITYKLSEVLSSLYHLENENYDIQKKYQELVVSLSRKYQNVDTEYEIFNENIELKKHIMTEIQLLKDKTENLMAEFKLQKEKREKDLNEIINLCKDLIYKLDQYKVRQLATKKIYLKYLSYI
ncbi:hypothetical protein A2W32_04550 [candidate division WWE3 bacterium RBG_16_37_10]|uniref:Uncharacterized protein n=1 Tax=candidate division WWE3 bacterium RBG_16_37_10 TaxID=1802610 RepID=A0A1F4V2X1_UNCKA|nr:MAG: hypothetical protein A2W32_04550 [candidate division WWE3 bacterium RBG_16_37_10]